MRFSNRLPAHLAPTTFARAVAARRASGAPLLDLTCGNPGDVGLAPVGSAVLAALSDPAALVYRPDPRGLREAREAVAGYYAESGIEVDPEQVVLTASTSEAYGLLFKLLCDPGEVVWAPEPSYPLFEMLAGLEAVRLRRYRLEYERRWSVERETLAVERGDRAVLVVSPNNPTGNVLDGDTWAWLLERSAAAGAAVICDEVFADYGRDAAAPRSSLLQQASRGLCFVLSGLSKVVGLPQLKLGWIVIAGDAALRDEALRRLELIADTYLSVATPVQLAAGRLLALGPNFRAAVHARIAENEATLGDLCAGQPELTLLHREAGWYALLRLPRTRDEEAWVTALLDAGVLVQPGWFYDLPIEGTVVLSLLTPPEVLREAVRRLAAVVAA